PFLYILFFSHHSAPTDIYTLSLHDALPISYVGTDTGLPLWREALAQHARYLGLQVHQVHIEGRRLGDRRTLSLGWLEYPAAGSRGSLQEMTQDVVAATLRFDGVAPGETNGATLTASLARGEIRVSVPPASPQQIC